MNQVPDYARAAMLVFAVLFVWVMYRGIVRGKS